MLIKIYKKGVADATPFSVQKKSNYKFLHAGRLRESEINFVFCERVLFYPLATKQYTVLFLPNSHVNLEPRVSCALHNSLPRTKDGKRQRWQGLDVLAIFPTPLSAEVSTGNQHPLQGKQRGLFILFGAVQPLCRQSNIHERRKILWRNITIILILTNSKVNI